MDSSAFNDMPGPGCWAAIGVLAMVGAAALVWAALWILTHLHIALR